MITDNGSPYVSAVHALAWRMLAIGHIRTLLSGWAYGAICA